MGTRCQLGIYETQSEVKDVLNGKKSPGVLIYRHWDGYPQAVIPDIKEFIEKFIAKRGFDGTYLIACLMAFLKQYHCGEKSLQRKTDIEIGGARVDVYGYGMDCELHGDIEYFYGILPDKIVVYKCKYNAEKIDFEGEYFYK